MQKKRILIAEDEQASANLLNKILVKQGYHVDVSSNGLKAINALMKENYDLLLTDWMMPQMDGIELIRKVRKTIKPAPVIIMITALTSSDARSHAINSGADGFITKPYNLKMIIEKVNDVFSIIDQKPPAPSIIPSIKSKKSVSFSCVCVAASSGGPQTLTKLFQIMPLIKETTFLVVQHGPVWALKDMAERWNNNFGIQVLLGSDGMNIEPGKLFLAPGDHHMIVDPDTFKLHLDDGPNENYVKPAADPLFRSAALSFGSRTVAIVLTGMGIDGTDGARHIAAAQGTVIVQDPETAIVSTMPKTAIKNNPDAIVMQLEDIPSTLEKVLKEISDNSGKN